MDMDNTDDFHEFSQEADEERLKLAFRDFLIAPEISGANRSYSRSKRIPAERVNNSGEIVEVAKELHEDDVDHDKSAVLVHRNAQNEITGIEIVCACGRRTAIVLESDDEAPVDSTDITVFDGTQGSVEADPQE